MIFNVADGIAASKYPYQTVHHVYDTHVKVSSASI
jgi:hypothetical protein